MRNDSRIVLGGLAVSMLCAFALAACSPPSTVAERWRDPSWSGPAIKSMLVVVVRRDPVRRRQWEDAFSADLEKRGVAATPSYQTFPDSVPSEDALQQAMKDSAFEGILLARNTGVQQSQSEVPPTTASVPGQVHWSTFYGTYITAYHTVYVPGYSENDHIVTNEVTIWDARKDGQMVWSASTATTNPTDAKALRQQVTSLIIPALKKDGIVP